MVNIKHLIKRIRKKVKSSTESIRYRLLAFLLIFMFTMLAGIMFLLSIFDFFPFGLEEIENQFSSELKHLSTNTSSQCGNASIQAIRMSQQLSERISIFMKRNNLSSSELKNYPELLESLLKEQLFILLTNINATDCSGVFLTLDATINPNIEDAENSKAGLYLRNIEPNIRGTGSEERLLLRGISSLARDNNLNLQAKWDLEFNIKDQAFWREPITAYKNNSALPLSRLIYWTSMCPIPELNEEVIVCSVPILDNNGEILGVCGFEISKMNFMLRHEPEINDFHKTVYLFSSTSNGQIRLDDALYSGNSAIYSMFPKEGVIGNAGNIDSFIIYKMPDDSLYIGMNNAIRVYPDNSPFAVKTFLASILIPKEDFDTVHNTKKMQFVLILFILVVIGSIVSIYLSKRFVKPIIEKLEQVGEDGLLEKTNIMEIDQLIEKIKNLHSKDSPLPDDLFEDFIIRVKTLTPTEMSVFRYYVDGKSFSEITKIMFFSMNTLKTHNSHIYSKLGVSSKNELALYIELIKKSGLLEEIG